LSYKNPDYAGDTDAKRVVRYSFYDAAKLHIQYLAEHTNSTAILLAGPDCAEVGILIELGWPQERILIVDKSYTHIERARERWPKTRTYFGQLKAVFARQAPESIGFISMDLMGTMNPRVIDLFAQLGPLLTQNGIVLYTYYRGRELKKPVWKGIGRAARKVSRGYDLGHLNPDELRMVGYITMMACQLSPKELRACPTFLYRACVDLMFADMYSSPSAMGMIAMQVGLECHTRWNETLNRLPGGVAVDSIEAPSRLASLTNKLRKKHPKKVVARLLNLDNKGHDMILKDLDIEAQSWVDRAKENPDEAEEFGQWVKTLNGRKPKMMVELGNRSAIFVVLSIHTCGDQINGTQIKKAYKKATGKLMQPNAGARCAIRLKIKHAKKFPHKKPPSRKGQAEDTIVDLSPIDDVVKVKEVKKNGASNGHRPLRQGMTMKTDDVLKQLLPEGKKVNPTIEYRVPNSDGSFQIMSIPADAEIDLCWNQ
jgi:hypothetical protein